jgi:hypothetical protein
VATTKEKLAVCECVSEASSVHDGLQISLCPTRVRREVKRDGASRQPGSEGG